MNPIIAFSVISKQIVKHSNALMKLEFDINASAASTVYVQIHDFPTQDDLVNGRTAPAAGTVPIKSWPTPAGATNGYKEFKKGELRLSYGLFVCVSTTQGTLTIGTGNNKFDSVATEMWDLDIQGTTETDTQNSDELQVFTAGDGKKLIRAACTNGEAAISYLMLFPTDSIVDGQTPIAQWTLAATGDDGDGILLDFGPAGLSTILNVNGIESSGAAYFALSSTPEILTTTTGTASNFYAEYLS